MENNTTIIYGYARCSTNEERQDINRQKRELLKLGVKDETKIYWEYENGTKEDRTELSKLLNIVKSGDTIITTEVSRLTRSTKHLCEILQFVQDKHLILNIGGSFIVDCSSGEIDPMTEGMIKMWGVFSEMERNIISQRVKSGLANAKAKGKKLGRPNTDINKIPDKFFKYYQLYKDEKIGISEMARLCNLSRPTIYNYIAVVEENNPSKK